MKTISVEEIERFILDAGSDDLPTFGGSFQGGVHCQQIADELAPCIAAIMESGAPIFSYLEIGVASGGTAFIFDHFFEPYKMVLIDDNRHPKAGLRPDILKHVPAHEIIGRSADGPTVSAAAALAPYDLIVIDGDHDYAAVRIDTLRYFPMLRPGGFAVLHDSLRPEWGVSHVVQELQSQPGIELVSEFASAKHPRPLGLALFRSWQ